MVTTFVHSFPPDPKADAENFQRKQAEYEAAYHRTGEPFVLVEALWCAQAARQLTPDWLVGAIGKLNMPFALYKPLLDAQKARQLTPDWPVDAISELITKNRANGTAERFKERMRHVQRYRCVRDWRNRHPDDSDTPYTKNQALELAAAEFEAADEATAQKRIENSYDRVSRDLKRLGQKSEFFWLVARSDPTRIPVSITRQADGVTVINGVAQRPKGDPIVGQTDQGGPTVSPTIGGGDRPLAQRSVGGPTVSPTIGGGTDR